MDIKYVYDEKHSLLDQQPILTLPQVMKLTVTLQKSEVDQLIKEAIQRKFPNQTVGKITYGVSAGYSDRNEYSPATLNNISIEVT